MLVALAAAFTACKKGMVSSETISVSTDLISTRADGDVDVTLQPLFLFWTGTNFNSTTATAPDFFVRTADGVIDDYKTTKYNTKVYYPLYDEVVYANGVAPAPGTDYISFAPNQTGDYSKFVINETQNPSTYGDDVRGVTDPLVGSATINGKDSAPLGKLLFKHATTQLFFRAQLAPTMTKFIDHVQVYIPGTSAAMTIEWNATDKIYEVKGGTTTDGYWSGNYWTKNGVNVDNDSYRRNQTMAFQLSRESDLRAGATLIAPPGNSIKVNIKYRQADKSTDFSAGNFHEVTVNDFLIEFKDASDNAVTLGAGDSYQITLFFDNYDIELVGKKVAWEDGGFISIPIQIR